ncbi:MAG: M55 family metallopeptidase [Defluviitaleaceae bacterium]|nr:M55 family metallopeptidase [Defluviitaleaceae bacterium]
MMKQLIVVADMEGASGIFEDNVKWLYNGEDEWRKYGRDCITSDVLAVCNAAVDFGIDDILLYDMHFAGNPEFNILLDKLPSCVRIFDVPDRCFDWRRIRGQAVQNPFGIITVGQHARYETADAYFEHTIQSPPIKNFFMNGLHIAEIGSAVLSFKGVPYLANIGCQASMQEALELSEDIICIPVKDKARGWKPSPQETYTLIYESTMKALKRAGKVKGVNLAPPYAFSMELCEGYEYDTNAEISWKGIVHEQIAEWTAPSLEIGLELFNDVRALLKRKA